MFKYRIISSIILIPCVIITLFFLPERQFKILIVLTCMLSALEWGKLSHFSSLAQKIWLLLIFISLSITFQLSAHQSFFTSQYHQFIAYIVLTWWFIALLLTLFYPNSGKLWNRSTIMWMIFGLLTILPFFWGILILKYGIYNKKYYTEPCLLLYIITLVWSMDSFSYIIGRTLGRHPITPKISPHKTLEGYIGGTLITMIIFWIFFKYIPINIEPLKLLIYSIIIILSSVLGDLTESMFKRESKIKNSGYLIPGHGGILDAIDSLYSTIPILSSIILVM